MASLTVANVSVVSDDNNDKLHCSSGALTGPHGLFVQALLAIVAFGALIGEFFTAVYMYTVSQKISQTFLIVTCRRIIRF